MTSGSLTRRGFTLVELLISMIVTAIIGAALVRMVLSQARFMDQQEAWREARSVSRGGINRLLSDLRAVEAGVAAGTGGLRVAAAGGQDFTVRVPYAFGVLCGIAANVYTVSLLPVDSTMFAQAGYTGFALRNKAGVYTYHASNVLTVTGTAALCLNGVYDSIHTVPTLNGSPAGKVANLTRTAGSILPAPDRGSIVYLYRDIRYEFKASTVIPGRTGLWRTRVTGGTTEELAAPFDATARVNFYNLDAMPAQAAVPPLQNVRGLELRLNGMSERTPAGSTAPKTANMTTSVFFENRPD
ncbi:MAG: prepilin-type N-terminal cleavage/methylation domain-containing protein [Gemmatimonadales bacterium]|nr:prepilin-type N-terminal cleavage/methylation domain-containing protein [Gemmatimonadales bacterium]